MIKDSDHTSLGNFQLKAPAPTKGRVTYNYKDYKKLTSNGSKLLSVRVGRQRDRSVPRMRQESARLDKSHPLASSIVSMTNLDDSTNALFVPRDNYNS
jgi:hypothetical protein